MNRTPQLRSAWPSTPQSGQKKHVQNQSSADARARASPPPASKWETTPAIPFNLLAAPSQRLYVTLFYLGLTVWRIYDYWTLCYDGTDGFWLFTKWVGIDTAFLYGLSGLNIPWLQWSSSMFTVLFVAHAVLNWVVMFQIPIPLFAWIGTVIKLMYDREYAVSERYVKPASIFHNSSVILGKQIIHILPEGSVMLNPNHVPSCIGGSKTSVNLPIRINQTSPIYMEILRIDLDTNEHETISVSAKELKKLYKAADREHGRSDRDSPRMLLYPVKQMGLYRLQTVIDESQLQVQRQPSDLLVVKCPMASIQAAPQNKCKGDLSNFYLVVNATPPFKVKYSKTVNRDDHGHTVLSIPSESSMSPSAGQIVSGVLVSQDPSAKMDVSWARTQSTTISLNESLGVSGGWQYTVDEVHDACGNTANYSEFRASESYRFASSKTEPLEQHFTVHDRPKFALQGYDAQHPMKVEKGMPVALPLHFSSSRAGRIEENTYTLNYLFTPQDEILPDQRHPENTTPRETTVRDNGRGTGSIVVSEPGLYSLHSVSSDFCGGEIMEPSSCQLINPQVPDLSISAEQIPDKCAGNSIGLIVELNLLGTPPFQVYYIVTPLGGSPIPQKVEVDRFHKQIELKPFHAGHYTYNFDRISDSVYSSPRSLTEQSLILEQDVRPPASASFLDANPVRKACIEEPVSSYVSLSGEPPFKIEYELLHRGRRSKRTIFDVQDSIHELWTEPLKEGGEYTLALTSINDATGCKRLLDAEARFAVGLQRPRASFGLVEGARSMSALENRRISLPLRLQGEPPWSLSYRKSDDPPGKTIEKDLWKSNDQIDISEEGTYEILGVHDKFCPGSVDSSAKDFSVEWIPRPRIDFIDSPLMEMIGGHRFKKAVCEGDEDSTEVSFYGTAPFNVEYEQHYKPLRGSQSTCTKRFTAGSDTGSLQMETLESGLYTYRFSKLGDASYNQDARKFATVELQQRVHPRPSASFTEAGKTYKYCKEEKGGGEVIPITLVGAPPFHLELETKHHTSAKPERISVPNVESNRYNLHLPHRVLALGSHSVTIRKVQDSRGCQRTMGYNAPHVQVMVADIPSISPLEDHTDFCVGDRISYALSGTPPFNVFYHFQDHERRAKVPSTNFRRIAEQPGEFVITALSDARSTDACKATMEISKTIHEMPSVRVSKGRTSTVDIHEGGEAKILFEFGGTPPFHYTYTRSTAPTKGTKATVLETRNGISQDYSVTVRASDEGMYEVVSIRDKYCAFTSQQGQAKFNQKVLKYE